MTRATTPPLLLDRIRAFAERKLPTDEFIRIWRIPIGDDEREEVRSLVRWFKGRYPTPAERLAYARRAYARWLAGSR